MTYFSRFTLAGLVALSLGACGQAGYMSGRQDGCVEAGGIWNADTDSCAQAVNWLIVQDADGMSFAFDDATDAGCPPEAFWSGTMTMTGTDSNTLQFSDRPYRLAFTQPTAEFVSGFSEAFSEASGGNPNAVLIWDDETTGDEKFALVELVAISDTSPSYDAESSTLGYSVCGLRLADPDTLTPLPDSEQLAPEASPRASGRYSLFIDLQRYKK